MRTVIFNKELFELGFCSDVSEFSRKLSESEEAYVRSVGYECIFFSDYDELFELGYKEIVSLLKHISNLNVKCLEWK